MNPRNHAGATLVLVGAFVFFAGTIGYATGSTSLTAAAVVDLAALIVVGIGVGLAQIQGAGNDPTGRRLADDDGRLGGLGAGTGLVLGVGLAATTAVLVGTDLALTAGYGAAGGLLAGTIVGRYAGTLDRGERPAARILPVSLFVGFAVGGLVGAIAAWSFDAAVLAGLEVGSGAGGLLSVILANVLIAVARRRVAGDPAPVTPGQA